MNRAEGMTAPTPAAMLRGMFLAAGVVLLLAGRGVHLPALGFALSCLACFWEAPRAGRLRWMGRILVPVLCFLALYGLLLWKVPRPGAAPLAPGEIAAEMTRLFLRSLGLLAALSTLEQLLRPLAARVRAGGGGGRWGLMLAMSYQLVPVFLQGVEGVFRAQRLYARLWWLRPSLLLRALLSLALLSLRLAEELAQALTLRLDVPASAPDAAGGPFPMEGLPEEVRRG